MVFKSSERQNAGIMNQFAVLQACGERGNYGNLRRRDQAVGRDGTEPQRRPSGKAGKTAGRRRVVSRCQAGYPAFSVIPGGTGKLYGKRAPAVVRITGCCTGE